MPLLSRIAGVLGSANLFLVPLGVFMTSYQIRVRWGVLVSLFFLCQGGGCSPEPVPLWCQIYMYAYVR